LPKQRPLSFYAIPSHVLQQSFQQKATISITPKASNPNNLSKPAPSYIFLL